MTAARSPRAPIVAAALLAEGVVDAADLARLGAALDEWQAGALAEQWGLPRTARAWRLARRDLYLAALAVLLAPCGAGPATAARRVGDRVRRFRGGAVLSPVDRLCKRVRELGRLPGERQVFNVLCRKLATAEAVDFIAALRIPLPPGHWAAVHYGKGSDDHDNAHAGIGGRPSTAARAGDRALAGAGARRPG